MICESEERVYGICVRACSYSRDTTCGDLESEKKTRLTGASTIIRSTSRGAGGRPELLQFRGSGRENSLVMFKDL